MATLELPGSLERLPCLPRVAGPLGVEAEVVEGGRFELGAPRPACRPHGALVRPAFPLRERSERPVTRQGRRVSGARGAASAPGAAAVAPGPGIRAVCVGPAIAPSSRMREHLPNAIPLVLLLLAVSGCRPEASSRAPRSAGDAGPSSTEDDPSGTEAVTAPSGAHPGGGGGLADLDGDGVPNVDDNCRDVFNPSQAITPGNRMGDGCMWPNRLAPANSDPWIARHHDDLRLLAPRVLVVNFANGIGLGGNDNVDGGPVTTADVRAKAQQFVDMLREGSRHTPTHPDPPPFLEPEITKVVDLQDGNGHANSDLFPRGVTTGDGYPLVGYGELFSPSFAPHLAFVEGGRHLTLGEAVDRGLVHDVILVANQVDARAPNPPDQVTHHILEVALVKQAYDHAGRPIEGAYVRNGCAADRQQAGFEGCDNSMAWPGRSLRIFFLNVSRGAGCLAHSLGHAFEWIHNESAVHAPGSPHHGAAAIPYLRPHFRRFAGFDLGPSLGAPFPSLYAGGDAYSYEGCGSGACTTLVHPSGRIHGYEVACGNVHYPPGAARGYDYYPEATVLSRCETFMQPWERAVPLDGHPWSSLEGVNDDCGGRFLTWWMQHMPGLDNLARTPEGEPMKNWWPFMYY